MKIVFLDAETVGSDVSLERFKQFGEFIAYEHTQLEDIAERLNGVQVAIVNKTPMKAKQIDACPSLQLICEAATGLNNIDVEYAASKGIVVKNVAGYSTESVTQLTFALLFSLMHQLPYFDNYVKSGGYSNNRFFTHYGYTFHELYGKQVGIIGMGTIGKRVATVAEAFGAKITYYSTSGKNNSVSYPRMELDELMRTSDVISIHAPLNEQTRNLITTEQLQLMKKSAYLINVGRGGIVNEPDLAQAIDNNLLAGAGFDVYSREPIPADHPYLKVKNKNKLILTPHIAWASIEARERLMEGVAQNIRDFINSKK